MFFLQRNHPQGKLLTNINDAFSFSPIHVIAFLFQYPLSFSVVDPEDAPDYYSIIKNPMDFGTIKKKLEVSCYALS